MKSLLILGALMVASAASAQTLEQQTSSQTASPLSAWQGGFAPRMEQNVVRVAPVQQAGQGCHEITNAGNAGDSISTTTVCDRPRAAAVTDASNAQASQTAIVTTKAPHR